MWRDGVRTYRIFRLAVLVAVPLLDNPAEAFPVVALLFGIAVDLVYQPGIGGDVVGLVGPAPTWCSDG